MKIVVLCGGLSMERDVSISSSALICRALRSLGHQAVLVDMYMGIEDDISLPELFETLPEIPLYSVPEHAPDLNEVRALRKWRSPSMLGKGVLELCKLADVVFLGLHGACGEDGRIQATLDLLGIPYTGSGCLGSALAMDKHLTKLLVEAAGLQTPKSTLVHYAEGDIERIMAQAYYPCVVKPVDSGSSVGVSIPHTPEELRAALNENLHLGKVLIERYIQGRELDVAVLEDRALPAIEIIPKEGFYDYKNKYQPGATVELCPAPIEPEIEAQLEAAALTAHRTLGLSAYSRSDFMVDERGEVWFLEINTLPGMTPTSLMPQEAAAAGYSYEALCQKLVELAMKEHTL
ncbi:MAG: D-alanine--D-alanine ligase [Clostridia bacterium]|nr:D-alanine--D-alanine ligase [Clostridia bacterium]